MLVDAAHEASYDPAITPCAVCHGVDYVESGRQAQAAPPLPDLPLVVLTHGLPTGALPSLEPHWRAWQGDLAARSPRGMLVVALGADEDGCVLCRHHAENDRPVSPYPAHHLLAAPNLALERSRARLVYKPEY